MAARRSSHTGPTVSGLSTPDTQGAAVTPSLFGDSEQPPVTPREPELPIRERHDVVAQLFHDVIDRPVRGSTRVARVERLMAVVDWLAANAGGRRLPRTSIAQESGLPYADLGVDLSILTRAHLLHSTSRGYVLAFRLVP